MTQDKLPHNTMIYKWLGKTHFDTTYKSTPAEVQTVQDLPKRLFMGSLEESSFIRTTVGYTARYVSTLDTRDKKGKIYTGAMIETSVEELRVLITLIFNGSEPIRIVTGSNVKFTDIIRYLPSINQTWEDSIKKLEGSNNINFALRDPRSINMVSFPDGYGVCTIVPISFLRIAKITEFVSLINESSHPDSPILASLSLTASEMRYREGKCNPGFLDESWLFSYTINRGFLPIGTSVWKEHDDGVRAHCIVRAHYNLVINSSLHDLELILALLWGCELINKRSMYDNAASPELEDMTWVVGSGLEVLREEFRQVSDDGSVLIVYPAFTNPVYIEHLVTESQYTGDYTDRVTTIVKEIESVYRKLISPLGGSG